MDIEYAFDAKTEAEFQVLNFADFSNIAARTNAATLPTRMPSKGSVLGVGGRVDMTVCNNMHI